MSNTLYGAFQGMASEVITVGTLMGSFDLADAENSNDEDVFTCGKCKKQFYSLHSFMVHKKIHQLGNISAGQKVLTETIAGDSSNETDLQLPIILSESDILSFNINQSGLNLTLPDQSLQAFEENEALIMPESEDSQLRESSGNLQIRSTQIILATQVSDEDGLGRSVLLSNSSQAGAPTFTLVQPQLLESTPLIVTENHQEEEDPNKAELTEIHNGAKATKLNKLECMYCKKVFLKNFDLQQHLRRHTGERPFQCVVCGRSFTQKSNVKKHMATHKVWPQKVKTLSEKPLQKIDTNEGKPVVLVDESFSCQFCSSSFKSFIHLKTHLKTHTDIKVFRCIQTNCNMKFEQLDQFLEHTAAHQAEQNTEYNCCKCDQTFTSLDDLGAHQQLHPNWNDKKNRSVAVCQLCKAKFKSIEALERHEAEDPHSYPCPECGKVLVCERLLRSHLRSHQSQPGFTCEVCDKGFKTIYSLNLHKKTHNSDKPFRCKLCNAAFARVDRLKRHMFIHDTSRRFKCPLSKHLGCQKEFYRKDKLKQHLLTHTVPKNLKCERCGRLFKRAAQLKRHETVCTSEDKPCKDCGHIISSLDKYKKAPAPAAGSHVNRRKHRLLASSKDTTADDGVSVIQVVVVPLPSAPSEPANS